MMSDLSTLQYKIVWELETWKKSEEAKFKFQLKKKEIDFLQKLKAQWKEKEFDQDKVFKQHISKLERLE